MKRVALAAALLLTLVACREDFFDPTPGDGQAEQQRVELLAQNIQMLPGEANAIRIGIQAKEGSVHVRIDRPDGPGRIIACPLRAIDDPLPAATSCLPDLPDGVREGLTLSGLSALALIREGGAVTIGLRADYAEAGRGVRFRFPVIEQQAGASACKDNACNPFFEMRPVQSGNFTATARWTGGTGRLEMLEGRVLARAFTSTGIPYRVAGSSEGSAPLSITAQLNAPSEFALALSNSSGADLTAIEIETSWP